MIPGTKAYRMRLALILLLGLLLLGSCAAGLFCAGEKAFAADIPEISPPDAYPEFYGERTEIFAGGSAAGRYCINYEYGCVAATGSAGAYKFEYFYAQNFDESGGKVLLTEKAEEIWALQLSRGLDANADLGKYAGGATAEEVLAAYKAAYVGAFADGIAPGIFSCPIMVSAQLDMLHVDLWYGDGHIFDGRNIPQSYIIYNAEEGEAYLVSAYMGEWFNNAGSFGVPYSGTLSEGTVTVNDVPVAYERGQMFEKGCILTVGGNTFFYYGERNEDGSYGNASSQPTITPPEAYPEFYGQQTMPAFALNGKYYLNYRYGYAEATPDESASGGYTFVYRYGRNIGQTGEESLCALADIESVIQGSGRIIVSTDAGQAAQVGQIVPEAEQAAMLEAFKDAYARAFGAGQVAGIPTSYIYVFNGSVIQNYIHGDGNGNNSTEAYILYDPAGKQAHVLTQTANTWLNSASTFGTAVSDYGTNTFRVNGAEQTAAGSQMFANGWLADGAFTLAVYDSINRNYITIEGFGVPGAYGTIQSIDEEGGVYYINYEHGAAAVQDGSATMYPGRNFNASHEQVMLEIDYFLGLIRDVPIANNAERIRAVLLEKYTELFEQGYFPGFADGQGYAIWNDTECLQFYWGDSIAVPFNVETDARTNVLFIHVKLGATAEEDVGYVVRDRMMEGWNKFILHPVISNSAVGAPLSDMASDGDCVYQQFQNYLLICVGNNFDSMVITKLSYEEWKAAQAALPEEPDYGGDYIDYTEDAGCKSSLSAAGIGVSAAVLAAAAAILYKKRRERS